MSLVRERMTLQPPRCAWTWLPRAHLPPQAPLRCPLPWSRRRVPVWCWWKIPAASGSVRAWQAWVLNFLSFFFFLLINLISMCFVHCWPFHRKDRTLFVTQFYVAMNSWQGKELVFGLGRKFLTNFSVTRTCGSSQWLVLLLWKCPSLCDLLMERAAEAQIEASSPSCCRFACVISKSLGSEVCQPGGGCVVVRVCRETWARLWDARRKEKRQLPQVAQDIRGKIICKNIKILHPESC